MLSLQRDGYISSVAIGGPHPPAPSATQPVFDAANVGRGIELEREMERDKLAVGGGAWGQGMGGRDWYDKGVEGRWEGEEEALVGYGSEEGIMVNGEASESVSVSSPSPSSSSPLSSSSSSSSAREAPKPPSKLQSPSPSSSTPPSLLPPPSSRRLWVSLKYHLNSPVLRSMNMVSKPTRRYWLPSADLDRLCRGEQVGHVRGMRGVGESVYLTTDRGIMECREARRRRVGGMVLCRVNRF